MPETGDVTQELPEKPTSVRWTPRLSRAKPACAGATLRVRA